MVMFAGETDKKPKSEPGLFFGVIISHAAIFPRSNSVCAAPSLSFHSLLEKEIAVLLGLVCVFFFLKKGLMMGAPLAP